MCKTLCSGLLGGSSASPEEQKKTHTKFICAHLPHVADVLRTFPSVSENNLRNQGTRQYAATSGPHRVVEHVLFGNIEPLHREVLGSLKVGEIPAVSACRFTSVCVIATLSQADEVDGA